MKKQYALEPLTMIDCPPTEMIHIAARTGYDFVSLRLIPMGVPGEFAFYPDDRDLVRATKAALQETGIGVHDIELARILKDVKPSEYVPAMEVGAELGARHLICSAWTDSRKDRNLIIERYAEICDLARPYGLTVNLEFPSFSRLTNLTETADILKAAQRPNCGILIDTLYYHFSRVSLEEISALPRAWFHFLHISDTPGTIPQDREGMIRIARDERLYPGEGCIDFAALDAVLPEMIYAIELPNNRRLQQLGYEEHARRCILAARSCLESKPSEYRIGTVCG